MSHMCRGLDVGFGGLGLRAKVLRVGRFRFNGLRSKQLVCSCRV